MCDSLLIKLIASWISKDIKLFKEASCANFIPPTSPAAPISAFRLTCTRPIDSATTIIKTTVSKCVRLDIVIWETAWAIGTWLFGAWFYAALAPATAGFFFFWRVFVKILNVFWLARLFLFYEASSWFLRVIFDCIFIFFTFGYSGETQVSIRGEMYCGIVKKKFWEEKEITKAA